MQRTTIGISVGLVALVGCTNLAFLGNSNPNSSPSPNASTSPSSAPTASPHPTSSFSPTADGAQFTQSKGSTFSVTLPVAFSTGYGHWALNANYNQTLVTLASTSSLDNSSANPPGFAGGVDSYDVFNFTASAQATGSTTLQFDKRRGDAISPVISSTYSVTVN